jgi:hypothetical protein
MVGYPENTGRPMRILLVLGLTLATLASAHGLTVDDESAAGIDADTLAAILALAARDAPEPDAVHVRKLHKSLARNGRGYCGEVSLADGSFTIFHAVIGGDTASSILRLADFPEADQSPSANTVRAMMRNFGCVQ